MQEIDIQSGSGGFSGGVGFSVGTAAAGRDRSQEQVPDSKKDTRTETKDEAPDKEQTLKSLRSAKDLLAERGVDLDFNLVGDDEQLQVEVRDPRSGKLIRKLPPDELIKLSESLDQLSGVMVDQPI